MAVYEVTLKEIEIYLVKVEADDELSAKNAAWLELENAENKHNYHHDSDSESDACEIDN